MPAVTLVSLERRGRSAAAAPRLLAAWLLATTIVVSAAPTADAADVLNVPADFPTIQAAIDAAVPGDTVTVAPGTYFENIEFLGKDITVHSSGGAALTTIDGQSLASVVQFIDGETSAAVLEGFTIKNGRDVNGTYAGGVDINYASPTIRHNVISDNIAKDGGGIHVHHGTPLIEGNTIERNSGCQGNGIAVSGAEVATVRDNLIRDNFHGSCPTSEYGGGGIYIAASSPLIVGNVISGNFNHRGAGIGSFGFGFAQIVRNVIVDNEGYQAGGIYLWSGQDALISNNLIARNSTPGGAGAIAIDGKPDSVIRIVNNTLFGNTSTDGADGISGDEWGAGSVLANNIVEVASGVALDCVTGPPPSVAGPPPTVVSNNFYSQGPVAIGVACGDVLAAGGNGSVPPMMVAPESGLFGLLPASPMIDSADDAEAPVDDFYGTARPADGDEDGSAQADVGAIEFVGPYVAGTVTANGRPVDQICVHAYSSPTELVAEGLTGATGQYVLFVPPGSYRIAFEDCARGLFLPEWHDDATSYDLAAPIDTSAGAVNGIDASLAFVELCDGKEPTMWGTRGNDTIRGTSGPDVIMGLAGRDTISGAGGADTICGGGGADSLIGGKNHDVLLGNRGSDLLVGGPGDDDMRGGPGFDEVSYVDAPARVVANLSTGAASGNGTDAITRVEKIRGSQFDDLLIGDAGRNTLAGEGGHDIIDGRGSRDILGGGSGDDLIDGGSGNDKLSGATGEDRLLGRGGDDELIGGDHDDVLQGGSGNDLLLGGDGHDFLIGGPGDDVLKGWRGNDTVSYETAGGSVVVDLVAQTGTGQGVDTLDSIESAVGSSFADTLKGSNQDNSLFGLGGKDTLTGGSGEDVLDGGGRADVLVGGSGRDLLLGGPGDDELDGGSGADAASWQFSNDPVRADLTAGSATGQGTDTFTSIEDLVGSAHDDTLIGNSGENILLGLGGDDRLYGRSWQDGLFGGDGDDILFGEIGDDYLDGDRGTDALNGGTGNDACVDGESHVSCEAIGDIAADSDATLDRIRATYRTVSLWFGEYIRPL